MHTSSNFRGRRHFLISQWGNSQVGKFAREENLGGKNASKPFLVAIRHLPARHVDYATAITLSLQLLRLELPRCLSDHHLWASLFLCSSAHAFTRTQRLGMSLLLLLGYAAVSAVIVSLTERTVGAWNQPSLSPEVGSHKVQINC